MVDVVVAAVVFGVVVVVGVIFIVVGLICVVCWPTAVGCGVYGSICSQSPCL